MGKFSVETQSENSQLGTFTFKFFTNFLRQLGRNQLVVSEPTLPSGLTVAQTLGRFEAIVEAVETLRRHKKNVPADLKLTDFEFSTTNSNSLEACLLPEAETRPSQPSNQDQATLVRIFYQLITNETLGRDIKLALTHLSLATTERPGMPEVIEVIERGLVNLYSSLHELNGAFGWAMYRYSQAAIQQRSSRIEVQPSLQNLTYAEGQPIQKTLKRNLWVITGLAGICLLTIVCLIVIANRPNLFATSSPKQAIAASSTATTTSSKSPDTTANPSSTATNLNTNNQNVAGGATVYKADVNQAKINSTDTSQLKVGQVAVWNAPAVNVIGVNWQANLFVYVATDDGNYTDYESHTSEKIMSTTNGLQTNDKLACWSPDGRNLAVLSGNNQVLLKSSANAMKVGASFPLPLLSNNRTPDSCQSLFSWSPDSQKLLIFSTNPQIWDFTKQTIQQIGTDKTVTYDLTTDNTVWSPDSSQLGVLVKNDEQGTQELFNIYDTSNWNWNGIIKLFIAPATPQQTPSQNFSLSNLHWSPDGRNIAAVLQTTGYNGRQPIITDSVQIFTLPKDIGALGQPLNPDQMNSTVIMTATSRFATQILPHLAWSPDGSKLAVATTNAYSYQTINSQIGTITVYNVDAQDIIHPLYNFTTNNYEPNYLTWSPEGDGILTANSVGNLRIWSLPKDPKAKGQFNSIFVALNTPANLNLNLVNANLQWSPEGKDIVATSAGFNAAIKLLNSQDGIDSGGLASNSASFRVVGQSGQWSPDGHFFAATVFLNRPSAAPLGANTSGLAVAVWKFENNQTNFYATVPLKVSYNPGQGNFNNQNSINQLPQWTFNADTKNPELLLLDNTGDVYSYDLSSPIAQSPAELIPIKLTGVKTMQASELKVVNKNSVGVSNTTNTTVTNTNTTNTKSNNNGNPSSPITNTQAIKIGHFMGVNFGTAFMGSWSNRRDAVITGANGHFTLYYITLLDQNYGDFQSFELFNGQTQNGPQVIRILFSPDDSLVAFGLSNGTVRVYDSSSGQLVTTIVATKGTLTDVAFSPDGKYLATTSSDRQVTLWKVSKQGYWPPDQILQGEVSSITHINFSPDSHFLLTQDAAGAVLVWRLN